MEISLSLSEILVTIIGLIATGLGFIVREQREKIKTIRNQLSEKKYHLYNELFGIFFDIIKQQKNKGIDEEYTSELGKKIIDLKKDLFIYAPDNIVKKFLEWGKFVSNNPGNIQHFKLFLELFVLIRKDMGNSKTKINEQDVLRSMMTTDQEFNKMRSLIWSKR